MSKDTTTKVANFLKKNKNYLKVADAFVTEYNRHINNHKAKSYAFSRAVQAAQEVAGTSFSSII